MLKKYNYPCRTQTKSTDGSGTETARVLQRTKTAAPATAEKRTAAKAPTWVFTFKVAAPLKAEGVVVAEPEPVEVELDTGVVIVVPYVCVEREGELSNRI